MKTLLPSPIESLFMRCPALWGFSVRGLDELPDNRPRPAENDSELFVDDVSIAPALSRDQYGEIFEDIVTTLAEMVAEEPDAEETLRGRTFARVLH